MFDSSEISQSLFNSGNELLEKGEYRLAMQKFLESAELGNSDAMNNLAWLSMEHGIRPTPPEPESGSHNSSIEEISHLLFQDSYEIEWLERAAELGNVHAMLNRGKKYVPNLLEVAYQSLLRPTDEEIERLNLTGEITPLLHGPEYLIEDELLGAAYWFRQACELNFEPAYGFLAEVSVYLGDLESHHFWMMRAIKSDLKSVGPVPGRTHSFWMSRYLEALWNVDFEESRGQMSVAVIGQIFENLEEIDTMLQTNNLIFEYLKLARVYKNLSNQDDALYWYLKALEAYMDNEEFKWQCESLADESFRYALSVGQTDLAKLLEQLGKSIAENNAVWLATRLVQNAKKLAQGS